jgi:hypothetical protein
LEENSEKCKYKIVYEFKIKNKKIYWTLGEGHGLYEFPNPY